MQDLISIIVPVYNVEQYLCACVESILAQNYTNWELFLVDDGSPDKCGDICDDYQKTDHRIHVIHKENGGLSDARNCAIDLVQGSYLTFIDSDDYVHPDYLKKMYFYAQKYEADIVQCDFCRESSKLGMNESNNEKEITRIYGENILKSYLHYGLPKVFACGKLYKSIMFQDIRYPVGLIDEDNFTTYKLMYDSKLFVNVNQSLYFYRTNQDSITNQSFSERKFGILNSTNEIRDFLKDKTNIFDSDVDYYDMRQLIQIYNNAVKANALNTYKDKFDIIYDKLCMYSKSLPNIDIKYRVLLSFLKFNKGLYNKIILRRRK